ncbi:MAG: hypothetical protein WCA63_10390, partial [Gallionella sp.]
MISTLSPNPAPASGRGKRDSAGEGVIKAVLFDLDGTFADTAPDLAAALNHARARRNLPPLP